MSAKDGKEELREEFVSRWSRLKEEARQAPPQKAPEKAPENAPEKVVDPKTPAPELPPLDALTFDSDYRAFFHPKVGEDVRRAALKKLFSDPRFNVMDGLDVYIDDYSKTEPIPPEMMATLRQAQKILEWAKEDEEQRKKDEAQQVAANQNQALEPPAAPSPSEIGFEENTPDTVPAAPVRTGKQAT
jgi:uncharacterized protein DUF3306